MVLRAHKIPPFCRHRKKSVRKGYSEAAFHIRLEPRLLKPREKSLRDAMSDLKRGEAMNTDYLLLCGVMWAQHASVDAREELVRARCTPMIQICVLLASALLEERAASA
jgi:hypothetical protein